MVTAAIAAIPLLVVVAVRDPVLLALGLPLLAAAIVAGGLLARVRARRTARPVEELAEGPAGWARVTRARWAAGTAWTSSTRWQTDWTAPPDGSPTC